MITQASTTTTLARVQCVNCESVPLEIPGWAWWFLAVSILAACIIVGEFVAGWWRWFYDHVIDDHRDDISADDLILEGSFRKRDGTLSSQYVIPSRSGHVTIHRGGRVVYEAPFDWQVDPDA